MADKSTAAKTGKTEIPFSRLGELQEAGLGNMMGLSTAWMEMLGDMGAEVMNFVADRIREDVKTQHEILHCKNVGELQHIQAQFLQKAIDQYRAETGKLVEMGTRAFAPRNGTETP